MCLTPGLHLSPQAVEMETQKAKFEPLNSLTFLTTNTSSKKDPCSWKEGVQISFTEQKQYIHSSTEHLLCDWF